MSSGGIPIEILLVEDDPDDVLLTRKALDEGRMLNNLHVVRDGVEAMDFLYQRGPYSDAPRPGIVLLDLNMPRKDGREVLAEVKSDELLKSIPIIVLTTSEAEQDILKSYNLHANAYVPKPVDPDEFVKVIRSFDSFWLSVVKLPCPGEAG
ncbi:MAG: response regulator [Dehalococcoidia bacterium]|nr:response regulator [Dehalococcoidia bacterium]